MARGGAVAGVIDAADDLMRIEAEKGLEFILVI